MDASSSAQDPHASSPLRLREVRNEDLPIFFAMQLDDGANRMAAFTSANPSDWNAFTTRWARKRQDDSLLLRTIEVNGQVAGYLGRFERFGRPEVCYWIGRDFWNQGLATEALTRFLEEVPERPILARVAIDNRASCRVLEKCGFRVAGHDRAFAHARGDELDELIFQRD